MLNAIPRPLVFADLDDTLFQTKRKMVDELAQKPYRAGALDREGKERSFMNEEQANLVDWFLAHATLIPVTARGTEEISRVKIPFLSWAITTHGAVVLTPSGAVDEQWQAKIVAQLATYQTRIPELQAHLTKAFKQAKVAAWARINSEYDGTAIYLVAKHTDSTRLDELYAVAQQVTEELGLDDFYVHTNSNNIAWLPHCIEKGLAAQYLIDKLRAKQGSVPILGLGDSLSDHSFLRHCSWFGMPKQSQLASYLSNTLAEQ